MHQRLATRDDEVLAAIRHDLLVDGVGGHGLVIYAGLGSVLVEPGILGIAPRARQVTEVCPEEDTGSPCVDSFALYTEEHLGYRELVLLSLRFFSPPTPGFVVAERVGGPLTRLRNVL